MFAYPLRTAALSIAAAVGLSACSYGYGPYGQSGISVGIGSGYDPYGYGGYGYGHPGGYGYSRLGYGYSPYWGWYDNFYYPGTGYYVYDIYRTPYRWTDAQRRYWTLRRQQALSSGANTTIIRDNWGDFDRRDGRRDRIRRSPIRVDQRSVDRPARIERSRVRVERSTARTESSTAREQRKSERASDRGSRGQSRRDKD